VKRAALDVALFVLSAGCGPKAASGAKAAPDKKDTGGDEGEVDSVKTPDRPDVGATSIPDGVRASDPITCVGADSIKVDHVYIRTDGDGITVRGACSVTVRDSIIVAGRYGLLIQGGGDIVIEESTVEGKTAAVAIPGVGSVKARRTKFRGFVSLTGGGDVKDGGGNTFE
jgi:hypothetical protein